MKYIKIITFSFLAIVAMASCKKIYTGGELDFSNSMNSYVALTEAGKSTTMKDTASNRILALNTTVREYKNYPITYDYTFSNNLRATFTDTIKVGALAKKSNITIPKNLLGTDTLKTVTITLSNAKCNGEMLTIGRGTAQVHTLKIIK